jgi:hypothetical protein
MLSWRLGPRFAARPWLEPGGVCLAFIILLSAPLLAFLTPESAFAEERRGLPGLLLLGLLAGAALALLGLGRRSALLELLGLRSRLAVQALALFGSALLGAGLVLLGSGRFPAEPAAVLVALPVGALHLTGFGVALLALPGPGSSRALAFLSAVWWLPALLLDPGGWQGWLRRPLEPGLALELAASDSSSPAAILPAALLAGAVFLAGISTASSATRTG